MRIFLTGGTGYVGGRLAAKLLERGHHVRVLVRDPEAARSRLGDQFEFHRGDLASTAGLTEGVAGCDAVIHTAALVKNWVRHREEFERVNVAGAWAMCQAALDAGVASFVYTSSFFALGPSPDGRPVDETILEQPPATRFHNDYQSTKYRAIRLLRGFVPRGLPLVTVVPTVVFGPGADTDGNHVGRILRLLKSGRFPGLIGGGGQRWNLAFVDDVVEGHLAALERGEVGETYILGGEERTLREVAAGAASALGKAPPTRSLSYGLCHALATVEEAKARLFGAQPQLTHGEIEIYRHDWIFSSRKASEQLGYTITPFDTAFQRTIDWVRGSPS